MTICLSKLDLSDIEWNHDKPPRRIRHAPRARSDLPRPMLIRDFQDAFVSQADGTMITSRGQYREHLKAHGMIEVGNEKMPGPERAPAITESDIAEAYEMCEQGASAKGSDLPRGWKGDPLEIAEE